MTDIVERARNKNWLWTVPGAMREELADEIERLRAMLDGCHLAYEKQYAEIERLRDEIKRLRVNNEVREEELEAEIGRLRASNKELVELLKDTVLLLELTEKSRNPGWEKAATRDSVLGKARAAVVKAEVKDANPPV